MKITVERYRAEELPAMLKIWNGVVESGTAFPQLEALDERGGREFFDSQSLTAVARSDSGEVLGLYILHPNNVGRCAHICNASYAVSDGVRGRGVGEALVRDCLRRAKELGFRLLQFNAVVATNTAARRLYEKLGFIELGVIRGGFLMKDGSYEDICPYYKEL